MVCRGVPVGDNPPGDWFAPDFVPSAWKDGTGGFGSSGTPGIILNTKWNSADIWLRRDFFLQPGELSGVKLRIFHDEDVEIYLNGVLAVKLSGFITDYDEFEISDAAAAALHPGANTLAVHCHNTTGGQGVDVGILTPVTVPAPDKR